MVAEAFVYVNMMSGESLQKPKESIALVNGGSIRHSIAAGECQSTVLLHHPLVAATNRS